MLCIVYSWQIWNMSVMKPKIDANSKSGSPVIHPLCDYFSANKMLCRVQKGLL